MQRVASDEATVLGHRVDSNGTVIGMHNELWGLHPANLIATPETETEASELVRDLLVAGWKAEDLVLGLQRDDDEPEDIELPPVFQGAELEARARVAA